MAASGGKDSTVLAHIMTLLNKRYDYGLDLYLLSIDEGIAGYRDASLDVCFCRAGLSVLTSRKVALRLCPYSPKQTVKRNSEQYDLPLKILSYDELYEGWTMDKVVQETGKKGNCRLFLPLRFGCSQPWV